MRPAFRDEFSEDYDALEVFNGFDAWSEPLVRNVLRDYLKLVARGKRYTATGNSDSHGLFFVDPGMPRNLVRIGTRHTTTSAGSGGDVGGWLTEPG